MQEGTFKTHIEEDREYFIFRDAAQPNHLLTKDFPLTESLVSFTELDFDELEAQFMAVDLVLYRLQPGCGKNVEAEVILEASERLASLAEKHIVLEALRLDYTERFAQMQVTDSPDYAALLFNHTSMRFQLSRFIEAQAQTRLILREVLNAESGIRAPYRARMAAYKTAGCRFPFSVLTTKMEMTADDYLTEVLYVRDPLDVIDFYVRECLRRLLLTRCCKHCGRWFFLTGHQGLEYCDRTLDAKGRTCREIGAFAVYAQSKKSDQAFTAYRREYKKRNAWLQAGKITKHDYQHWCGKAKMARNDFADGKITLETFLERLKED